MNLSVSCHIGSLICFFFPFFVLFPPAWLSKDFLGRDAHLAPRNSSDGGTSFGAARGQAQFHRNDLREHEPEACGGKMGGIQQVNRSLPILNFFPILDGIRILFRFCIWHTVQPRSRNIAAHARAPSSCAPILAWMGECFKWAEWIDISLHFLLLVE